MKHQSISVEALLNEAGEIEHFLWTNGGGKFSVYDVTPAKAESVVQLLRELTNSKES